jgi:hypothetical protein
VVDRGESNGLIALVIESIRSSRKGVREWWAVLALAVIYESATRTAAAKIGGVGLQIVRDWLVRLNARGLDGQLNGRPPGGEPSRINEAQRWAKRGASRCAPHDQRTASTYIFGAICPRQSKGAALIQPACSTAAMNR